jgi:hypothetical protein
MSATVRPVVFSLPGPEFAAFPGTGFLVQYGCEVFFLTAKHVLADFDLHHLRIYYHLDRPETLPGMVVSHFTSLDPDDTDHADIVCVYVPPEYLLNNNFGEQLPFYLGPSAWVRNFLPFMPLYFKGLSPERSVHDYANNSRRINFICGESKYFGPAEQKDMHVLLVGSTPNMPDFDGLSGSPVFFVEEPHSISTKALLAGMLLRGGRRSGYMRFVSASQIVGLIERNIHQRHVEYARRLLGET